jgi:hypothetical protein
MAGIWTGTILSFLIGLQLANYKSWDMSVSTIPWGSNKHLQWTLFF